MKGSLGSEALLGEISCPAQIRVGKKCYHPTGNLEKEELFKYRKTVLNKERRILTS